MVTKVIQMDADITPAAAGVMSRGEGAAPPASKPVGCWRCRASGEARAQVRASLEGVELYLEAPCTHTVGAMEEYGRGRIVLAWGGRPGYTVLPEGLAEWFGYRFIQAEDVYIHILGQKGGVWIGLALLDEDEALALARPSHLPCGTDLEEILPEDLLGFIRERLRVACPDERLGHPGEWMPLEK